MFIEPAHVSDRHMLLTAVLVALINLTGIIGCDDASPRLDDASSLDELLASAPLNDEDALKRDDAEGSFPAERDLAIIIPKRRAVYSALNVIPESWIHEVDDALLDGLGQRISEENSPEDWTIVSARLSPCNPLGHVADTEEIDRLCWPEVRLVLQPLVQLERPERAPLLFADDRSIHALYRVNPHDPALLNMLALIKRDATLDQIDAEVLSDFETARDQAVAQLLGSIKALRVTDGVYAGIAERPEFTSAHDEARFWEAFTELIVTPYCAPSSLYHLTAMSLPLGRDPVQLDLWSFIAFDAMDGVLERADLLVRDRETGAKLLSFNDDLGKMSEEVSAVRADPALMEIFKDLNADDKKRLYAQSILDRRRVSRDALQIVDPYTTLVSHTTCSSCHRFNQMPFNFHNLSYFNGARISVSSRVENDVKRELEWVKAFLQRADL